jgi:hypothetical protein
VKFEDEREKRSQSPLRESDSGTIEIEVRRGYITKAGVDVGRVPYTATRNCEWKKNDVRIQLIEDDMVSLAMKS